MRLTVLGSSGTYPSAGNPTSGYVVSSGASAVLLDAGQGVAVALTLGIIYFMLTALFGRLGEVDVLPPFIGAWAPVVLAILFAVNRLTTLRT